MQEENTVPFPVCGNLSANPHLYDYLHELRFSKEGFVEMLDGAGQRLNAIITGRFSVQTGDQSSAFVEFFDLVEMHPYRKEVQLGVLDPIKVIVTREEGIFAFREQIIWNIRDEQEWPCLLYRVRYVFESDPLEQVLDNRGGNLYYLLEEEEPDTRYYYCLDDRQELTLRELIQMGISIR